jgi:hydrogenase maturation protease
VKKNILIAGIGNIFHGDDAFGTEVVRYLQERGMPDGVHVQDFGIRSYDLAFALLEGYATAILIDALARGEPPGTVSVLDLNTGEAGDLPPAADGHGLSVESVLQMVRSLPAEGELGRLFLVGCEPATLECEEGVIGLSSEVAAAVPIAAELITSIVRDPRRVAADSPCCDQPLPGTATATPRIGGTKLCRS